VKYRWGVTDREVIAKYSSLFDLSGVNTSQMQWGFQGVWPGWLPILEHLCARLQLISGPEFKFTSVKEKMGTLRIAFRGGDDATDAEIERAQAMALITCMACGAAGELREREGLWAVRCGRCAVE
jgi:hypothetical protein